MKGKPCTLCACIVFGKWDDIATQKSQTSTPQTEINNQLEPSQQESASWVHGYLSLDDEHVNHVYRLQNGITLQNC